MSEAYATGASGVPADHDHHPALPRIQRVALIAGGGGLLVSLIILIFSRELFFQSYLYAFLFWLGIPLGCLALLMIQHLTGGTWGLVIRRLLECGTRMLIVMAVLFLPVWLFGIGPLYIWDDHHGNGGEHAAPPPATATATATTQATAGAAAREGEPPGEPRLTAAQDQPLTAARQEPRPPNDPSGEAQLAAAEEKAAPGHGVGASDHPNVTEHAGEPDHAGRHMSAGQLFKSNWLTTGGYRLRAAVYFAVWIGLAWLLNFWSDRQDATGDPRFVSRFTAVSGPGLLLYVLTMTLASFDWAMSLDPHWYSTIFGILFIVGQGLSTIAFIIVMVALLSQRQPLAGAVTPGLLNDLGNLLLAFTMLWAYMSFSQFLIMWAANIAEEVTWYHYRKYGGWQYIAIMLIVLHFALPFLLLLSRRIKRAAPVLAGIALFIIVMRWLDLFWVLAPSYLYRSPTHPPTLGPVQGIPFGTLLAGLAAMAGIGGVWVYVYIWQLKRRPLLPRHDYRLADLEAAAHAHH